MYEYYSGKNAVMSLYDFNVCQIEFSQYISGSVSVTLPYSGTSREFLTTGYGVIFLDRFGSRPAAFFYS